VQKKIRNLQRPLAPGALAQDLVQVEGDGVLGDESLHFVLQAVGQDPHQGLGGETVLGALLVISCDAEKETLKARPFLLTKNTFVGLLNGQAFSVSDVQFEKPLRLKRPHLKRLFGGLFLSEKMT
jgi:hypothetical protein